MSNQAVQPTKKRSRAPQVASVFAAAKKIGLQVTGASIKDGTVELRFGPDDAPTASGNPWDQELAQHDAR